MAGGWCVGPFEADGGLVGPQAEDTDDAFQETLAAFRQSQRGDNPP